jgi:hypothetical protein
MNVAAQIYSLYGWRVFSEIPLPAPLADNNLSTCDVEIRWGEVQPALEGPIIACLLLEGGRGYTLADLDRRAGPARQCG